MTQFNVGDTVRTVLAGLSTGTIAFGPYRTSMDTPERYLVQREDGTTVSVLAQEVRPFVRWRVGEALEERAMGRAVTVKAGPFRSISGRERYVVEFSNGTHGWVTADGLRTRQNQVTPDSYTLHRQTFDLAATYRDRQGDDWVFNGKTDRDGMPLMDATDLPHVRGHRLSSVINEWGPLNRV
ncbi:phiSA1p31-related protein [Streptomyces sp. NPDC015414]|uniref:phiSA1p31-related protein n=1 Tax=Streptomyces sp. NPDC015414 TaxID=3364957 RepID=UPI0036FEABA1